MGERHWRVEVLLNNQQQVAIESGGYLTGDPNPDVATIREAAEHLLGFIGEASPSPSPRERRLASALFHHVEALDVWNESVQSIIGRQPETGIPRDEGAIELARAILASPEPAEPVRRVPSVRESMAKAGIPWPGDSGELDRLCRPASIEPAEPADPERIYPCADCGVMRTKAEGGTTFTVCDECWDKHHGKAAPDPASEPRAKITRLDDGKEFADVADVLADCFKGYGPVAEGMWARFSAGTLHLPFCNANHEKGWDQNGCICAPRKMLLGLRAKESK